MKLVNKSIIQGSVSTLPVWVFLIGQGLSTFLFVTPLPSAAFGYFAIKNARKVLSTAIIPDEIKKAKIGYTLGAIGIASTIPIFGFFAFGILAAIWWFLSLFF